MPDENKLQVVLELVAGNFKSELTSASKSVADFVGITRTQLLAASAVATAARRAPRRSPPP